MSNKKFLDPAIQAFLVLDTGSRDDINLGYTLLEILLVIVLVSIIATIGLFVYQQHTTDAKVSQTAQQMQQLLQAASAYYVDNQCWPNDPQCQSNVLNFNQYIPLKNPTNPMNPWGEKYSFQEEGVYGKKFQVFSGKLPPNIPERVAALLPNAVADTKHGYVLAEINVPSAPLTNTLGFVIATIGQTPRMTNREIYPFSFPCPMNWSGRLALSYNYIHADDYNSFYQIGSKIISTLTGSDPPTDASGFCQGPYRHGNLDYYSCRINLTAVTHTGILHKEDDLGSASFTYIGFCLNPASLNQRYNRL